MKQEEVYPIPVWILPAPVPASMEGGKEGGAVSVYIKGCYTEKGADIMCYQIIMRTCTVAI